MSSRVLLFKENEKLRTGENRKKGEETFEDQQEQSPSEEWGRTKTKKKATTKQTK